MHPTFCLRAPALLITAAALLALPLYAQPGTSIIEGRVSNAATGTALVNARVSLEGAGRDVITDAAARISASFCSFSPACR